MAQSSNLGVRCGLGALHTGGYPSFLHWLILRAHRVDEGLKHPLAGKSLF